ncbi:MAG: molybdenum cofactor guanylyltransferase MobA [Acidovorax sp.]
MIAPADITGLVLAGGRGQRMGGVDKGLQRFRGELLALHALRRLQPQVGALLLSANRNHAAYAALGVPVCADAADMAYAGPLAGFLAGLVQCRTPWLLTAPCDSPLLPIDLAARLAQAVGHADIAFATTAEGPQPVFCLLRASLREDLARFTAEGGRKIAAWTARHRSVPVPFGDTRAFSNANTLAELQALEA